MAENNPYKKDITQKEAIQRLKNFKHICDGTCRECGYSGHMGIVKDGDSKKEALSFILAFIAGVVICYIISFFIPLTRLTIILFLAYLVVVFEGVTKANQRILICPNCGKKSTVRKGFFD